MNLNHLKIWILINQIIMVSIYTILINLIKINQSILSCFLKKYLIKVHKFTIPNSSFLY